MQGPFRSSKTHGVLWNGEPNTHLVNGTILSAAVAKKHPTRIRSNPLTTAAATTPASSSLRHIGATQIGFFFWTGFPGSFRTLFLNDNSDSSHPMKTTNTRVTVNHSRPISIIIRSTINLESIFTLSRFHVSSALFRVGCTRAGPRRRWERVGKTSPPSGFKIYICMNTRL